MSAKTEARLRAATTAQRALDKAEAESKARSLKRDTAVLAAADSGAKREELQAATNLSPARVTQVLRRARARR